MQPLDRLRLQVTMWYSITFLLILLVVGTALFFAISHQREAKLYASLQRAAQEITRATQRPVRRPPDSKDVVGDAVDLRIPDRMLYLLDPAGRAVYPDTASAWVRHVARAAGRDGTASLRADIGHEHTLLARGLRFVGNDGDTLVAVAAADSEELEDEFWHLITLFAGALALGLAAVTVGGYLLARKSTVPVEQSMERMRRFMADAAHELRTPVSVLRAQTDVARQRPRSAAELEQLLDEIASEAERLGVIVNDLFTLARADAGERRVTCERFFLDDVALDAANQVRALANQRGIRVDLAALDEAAIEGDPALVRQLITILLDNAIKYTSSGGAVRMSVVANGRGPALVIEDTGIGIPADALPRIRERFFRGDVARQTSEGAGLGLSIAEWIATVHQARMTISSTEGSGTRVEVGFPGAP